jgi:ankyrin repeat protein
MKTSRSIIGACVSLLFVFCLDVNAEARFALVIGNGAYAHAGKLSNPTNDAQDMAGELKNIGFTVDLLVNSDLATMENAVVRLGNQLSTSTDAVGFFYYAGHGVQSAGINYLIPTDANIPSASFLQQKSLSLQSVLDTLQASGNMLNVVVLDACRDNPFSWSRSGMRGLSVVGTQPPGSIVVYATSAGTVAQDGQGRNGVFTGELLKHLGSPGTDIADVIKQTGAAVSAATAGSQIPAVYTQFFDSYAFVPGVSNQTAKTLNISVKRDYGSIIVSTATDGMLSIDGNAITDVHSGANVRFDSVEVGDRSLEIHYVDGQVDRHITTVEAGKAASVYFIYQTDLFKLARAGTPQSVQAAIAKGANVNARDANRITPLGNAARYNQNPEVITTLLQSGADIGGTNGDNDAPLMLAAMYNQNPEVIKTLLKAGAAVNALGVCGMTPLGYASSTNTNPAVITLLLNAGADKDWKIDTGLTPLMLAAMNNQNPEIITTLLVAGAKAKEKSNDGKTALDYAQWNVNLKGTDAYQKLKAASK